MDDLSWEILWKWMIWRCPPFFGNLHVLGVSESPLSLRSPDRMCQRMTVHLTRCRDPRLVGHFQELTKLPPTNFRFSEESISRESSLSQVWSTPAFWTEIPLSSWWCWKLLCLLYELCILHEFVPGSSKLLLPRWKGILKILQHDPLWVFLEEFDLLALMSWCGLFEQSRMVPWLNNHLGPIPYYRSNLPTWKISPIPCHLKPGAKWWQLPPRVVSQFAILFKWP